MTDTYLTRRYAALRPNTDVRTKPDGTPAPTGYYPDMSGVNQGRATFSPVFDDLYPKQGWTGPFTNERVDQHPYMQVTATWTPVQGDRRSGRDDPLLSGPPRPTPRLLSMFFRRAAGASNTRLMDVPGHTFPATGSQDGASTTWYVSPQAAMAPYNTDLLQADGQMPDSLMQLPPSPSHGWTAQPVFNVKATENRKAVELIQQQRGRNDRLAQSTYAGQTYSNRTARVANPAGAVPTPSRRTRG